MNVGNKNCRKFLHLKGAVSLVSLRSPVRAMLVTVFCAPRDRPETIFSLDVSPELELRDFVALCELESGVPASEIQIVYVEQQLKDPTRALGNYGVKDGDVVELRQAEQRPPPPTQPAFPGLPRIDFRSITVPGTSGSNNQRNPPVRPPQQPQPSAQPSTPTASRGSSSQGLDDPALLQQMLLSSPHELSLLKERNPPLAEALLSGDLERFTKVFLEQQQDRAKREQERIRLLTADPFDLEAQAKIEEDIRQSNVEENMTIAMEEAPESFGQVVMLYINCKVNGHPVKAFVDSGAQMTIMSQACAERCNIMRLVDRRWAGIAKGVGTQKIIGRVHLAQVQIEGDFLPCSFSILEDQPMDMLLGLDMLKRHQCSIDLKKNVLLIGTTGTETRFLVEAELPECARLAYGAEGREENRPEEIADRELAEALQRSIQESDTAGGQTTSPQLPSSVSLPKISSTYSEKPPSPIPGPSSLVPTKAATLSSVKKQDLKQPGQSKGQTIHLSEQIDPSVPSTSCPITADALPSSPMSTEAEEDRETINDAKSTTNPELASSPVQPMEQEERVSDQPHLPVEMAPASVIEPEPESEHRTRTNSIPSLAAALKELHELIVSNKSTSSDCPHDPFAPVLSRLSSQDITPQTVVGPFPVEHIQRIQAAGFSAREAAEALEKAQGEVERALFALLARRITVPT
uniref:Protein DDI1 homolog 2 n=1 Tax=Knipowitschia caucasica TaxID=637954 RepID=A0AAV2M801_KNICA